MVARAVLRGAAAGVTALVALAAVTLVVIPTINAGPHGRGTPCGLRD